MPISVPAKYTFKLHSYPCTLFKCIYFEIHLENKKGKKIKKFNKWITQIAGYKVDNYYNFWGYVLTFVFKVGLCLKFLLPLFFFFFLQCTFQAHWLKSYNCWILFFHFLFSHFPYKYCSAYILRSSLFQCLRSLAIPCP